MYAIVQSGGHQYRVAEGDEIEVELLGVDEGDTVKLDQVLLVSGDGVKVGQPYVEGAVVEAQVLGEAKGKKITVLRYRNKSRYRRQIGHRQKYTRLRIDSIKA
jgi:large subunit ribosomal protein L21